MYKRIDVDTPDVVMGFSYLNSGGVIEYVEMDYSLAGEYVNICADDVDVNIYRSDIPKLILALQEAYEFKGN